MLRNIYQTSKRCQISSKLRFGLKTSSPRVMSSCSIFAQGEVPSMMAKRTWQLIFPHHSGRNLSTAAMIEEEFETFEGKPPFQKLLAANRGEIATRIMRASSELGVPTVGIYAYEGELAKEINANLNQLSTN